MKKFGLLLAAVGLSLLLCGSAMAAPYSLMFDADGSNLAYSSQQIYGWDLEGFLEAGELANIVTHQYLGADGILNNGDLFDETFTVRVLNGTDADGNAVIGGGYYNFPGADLYLDITLSGYIGGYTNGGDGDTTVADAGKIANDDYISYFNFGSGALYTDTDADFDFTAADTTAATFGMTAAAPIHMDASVFNGAGSDFSLAFKFNTINDEGPFFAQDPSQASLTDLIGDGFLLTVAQGGLYIDGIVGVGLSPDQILLGFGETGVDAKFDAVPEPGTMLLLGFGLLGIAGFSRKRLIKKN